MCSRSQCQSSLSFASNQHRISKKIWKCFLCVSFIFFNTIFWILQWNCEFFSQFWCLYLVWGLFCVKSNKNNFQEIYEEIVHNFIIIINVTKCVNLAVKVHNFLVFWGLNISRASYYRIMKGDLPKTPGGKVQFNWKKLLFQIKRAITTINKGRNWATSTASRAKKDFMKNKLAST